MKRLTLRRNSPSHGVHQLLRAFSLLQRRSSTTLGHKRLRAGQDFEPAQYLVSHPKIISSVRDHSFVDRFRGREELTTKALISPKAAKAKKQRRNSHLCRKRGLKTKLLLSGQPGLLSH
ncbi:MAG: hypothetical protein CM1200mP27_00570 [Chloroflexota bacterium]|nr:MAG: hypothetical protein CM1200mP27_00570 [Chloroflexota bacterium]